MPKFEEYSKKVNNKEAMDTFKAEEVNKRYNQSVNYYNIGTDALDEHFKNKIEESDYETRTKYYFEDAEMLDAKVQRYKAFSKDKKLTNAFSDKYENHYAHKRRKAASEAADAFDNAAKEIRKFDSTGKNPLELYEHYEKVMQYRLEGMLKATKVKSKSDKHESYLKGKAGISCAMMLKDQLANLMVKENVTPKMMKIFEAKDKELDNRIEKIRQALDKLDLSSTKFFDNNYADDIETEDKKVKIDSYEFGNNIFWRKRNQNDNIVNDGLKAAVALNHLETKKQTWPLKPAFTTYDQKINKNGKVNTKYKGITRTDIARLNWNEKYESVPENEKRVMILSRIEDFENLKFPSIKELEKKSDILDAFRNNLLNYYDVFYNIVPAFLNAKPGSFEQSYLQDNPQFKSKIAYYRDLCDYFEYRLKYENGIGRDGNGKYDALKTADIKEEDNKKRGKKSLKKYRADLRAEILSRLKNDDVSKASSSEASTTANDTKTELASKEETKTTTETVQEATTKTSKEKAYEDKAAKELFNLRMINKNLSNEGYKLYKVIEKNKKELKSRKYSLAINALYSEHYVVNPETHDEQIDRLEKLFSINLTNLKEGESSSKKSDKKNKNWIDLIRGNYKTADKGKAFVNAASEDIKAIFDGFTLPTAKQLDDGWIEKTFKDKPEKMLEMFRKAECLGIMADEIPAVKEMLEQDTEFANKRNALLQLCDIFRCYMKENYSIDPGQGALDLKVIKQMTDEEISENSKAKSKALENYKTVTEILAAKGKETVKDIKSEKQYRNSREKKYYDNLWIEDIKETEKLQKINKNFTLFNFRFMKVMQKSERMLKDPVHVKRMQKAKERAVAAGDFKNQDSYTTLGIAAPLLKPCEYGSNNQPVNKEAAEWNDKWTKAWEDGDMNTLDSMVKESLPELVKFDLPTALTVNITDSDGYLKLWADSALNTTSLRGDKLAKYFSKCMGLSALVEKIPCLQEYAKEHPEFKLKCKAASSLAKVVQCYFELNNGFTSIPEDGKEVGMNKPLTKQQEKELNEKLEAANQQYIEDYDAYKKECYRLYGGIEYVDTESQIVDEKHLTTGAYLKGQRTFARSLFDVFNDKDRQLIREYYNNHPNEQAPEWLIRERKQNGYEDKPVVEEVKQPEIKEEQKPVNEEVKKPVEAQGSIITEQQTVLEENINRIREIDSDSESEESFIFSEDEKEIDHTALDISKNKSGQEVWTFTDKNRKNHSFVKKETKNIGEALKIRKEIMTMANVEKDERLKPLYDFFDAQVKQHIKKDGKLPIDKKVLTKKDVKDLSVEQIGALRNAITESGLLIEEIAKFEEVLDVYNYYDNAIKEKINSAPDINDEVIPHEAREEKQYNIELDTNLDAEYERQVPDSNDCWSCAGAGIFNHFIRNEEKYQSLKTNQIKFRNDNYKFVSNKEIGLEKETYDLKKADIEEFTLKNHSSRRSDSPMGDPYVTADFYLKRFSKLDGFKNTAVRKATFNPVKAEKSVNGYKGTDGKTVQDPNALHNLTEKFKETVSRAISGESAVAMLIGRHYVTITAMYGDTLSIKDSLGREKFKSVSEIMSPDIPGIRELVWFDNIKDPKAVAKEFSALDYDEKTGSYQKNNKSKDTVKYEEEIAHTLGVGVWKSYTDKDADISPYVSEGIYLPKKFNA